MQTLIRARASDGNDVDVSSMHSGVLLTAPIFMHWTAKQYGYQSMATAAVAALVVRPTTVAMVTLYNNSQDKSYVIDRVFAHNLVGVANSAYQLWLCVHPVGMTKPTNDITVNNNTGGRAAGGSSAIFDNGATVVDDGWFIWGPQGQTVTVTTPGGSLEALVDGKIILPPTAALSVHVLASTTGATFTAGIHRYEVPSSELE